MWNIDSESNAESAQEITYSKFNGAHAEPTDETGQIKDTSHSTHHSDLTETGARNYAGDEGSGNQTTGAFSTNIAGADVYQIIAHDEIHTETTHTSPDTATEVWGDHQEWVDDYYDWVWHPNWVNYPYQMDDYDDYGNVVGSHSEDNWIDEGDWSWDLIEEGFWTTVPDEDPHWDKVDGEDIEAESESDATLTLSGTEQFSETTSGDSFDDFGNGTQTTNHTYSLYVTTHTRSDDGQGHVDEDSDSRNEAKSDESSRYGLLGDVHFAGLGANGVVGSQNVGAPLQLHHPAEPKGGELSSGHAAGGGLAEGIGDFASGQAASGAASMDQYAAQNLDLLHQYCFARETLVLTKRGMLPIVDVQPNDEVRAVPDHAPHSVADWYRVERVYHNDPAALLNVHVEGLEQPIRATHNHPWYVVGRGWTSTAELAAGDMLVTADGRSTRVNEILDNGDVEPVFNLCVAKAHTYFVGDESCAVLVHNQSLWDSLTAWETTVFGVKMVGPRHPNAGGVADFGQMGSNAVEEVKIVARDTAAAAPHFAGAVKDTFMDGRASDSLQGQVQQMGNNVIGAAEFGMNVIAATDNALNGTRNPEVHLQRFDTKPVWGHQKAFEDGKVVGDYTATEQNLAISAYGLHNTARALATAGTGTAIVGGGEAAVLQLSGAAATVAQAGVGATQVVAGTGAYANQLHTVYATDSRVGTSGSYPRDFRSKRTNDWSGQFNSEAEARTLARQKLGKDPVEIEPGKWRSQDGKWQYRAKPGDVSERHIHLEELDPETGEVLQNLHLRWPEGAGR